MLFSPDVTPTHAHASGDTKTKFARDATDVRPARRPRRRASRRANGVGALGQLFVSVRDTVVIIKPMRVVLHRVCVPCDVQM